MSRSRCSGSGSTCRPATTKQVRRGRARGGPAVPVGQRRRRRRHGRPRHAAAAQWRPTAAGRWEARRGSTPILVNMERWRWLPHDLGAFYVTVNIPEFTLARGRGGHADPHRARGGRQARQADAGVLRRDGGGRLQSVLERAQLHQERGDRALFLARAAASSAAAGIPPCSGATVCASNTATATSIPIRSIGAATTSAISISFSRRDPATCSAT